jgi:hypothetical protein
VRLSIDRIVVQGAGQRLDPRALRSSIERELARGLAPPRPAGSEALERAVGEAVRVAVKGEAA